jgi:hypothetical protein
MPILVFILMSKRGGKKMALPASLFLVLTPIYAHYSKLPTWHIPTSSFSLLTFVLYYGWTETGKRSYYLGMYISLVLGTLSDWIAYFVVPPILLHYLICEYKKTKNWKFVLFFALTPLVSFSIHLGWTYMLGGQWALEGLLDRFLARTVSGGAAEGKAVFTLWDLYAFGYIRAKLFLTPTVCFLSAVWFVSCTVAALHKKLSRQHSLVLALLLFGLSHNLVFSNRVYYHDIIMFFHLTPFFAVAAALGAQFIIQKILRNKWVWTVPFILVIGYSFSTQSTSALGWLLDTPVVPETYIVGSKVNEITDENAKVLGSFEPNFRMLFYVDRPRWSVVRDLNAMKGLLEEDESPNLYIVDSKSAGSVGRELREYLVRNHPVETFYGYSFFNLREVGSSTIPQNLPIEHPAEVNFDDKLMFLGYNVEEVVQKKKEPSWLEKYLKGAAELLPEHRTFFQVTYFWRCLEEIETDYTLVTQFEGHHGKTYRIDQSHQGVNGAYPTSMWQAGEVIREEYQVEIPPDYPPIRYALRVGVRDGKEGLEVVRDAEADEEDRGRLGEIEVLPAERPTPLAAEPKPQNKIEMNINDDLVFLGYDLTEKNLQPGDRLKLTTYWQSLGKTEEDYTIQAELRNGGYKVREVLDIAPTRLWEEGKYYQGDTVIAINPHLLGRTYSLNLGLERADGTGTQVNLASLDIPCQRRHIIRRWEKANYRGSKILSPDEPLSLRFDLREKETLELVAGWTGKSEFEETRVEVYIAQPYSSERYLGTWVIRSGRYTATKRRIPSALTAPGQNVVELRVPEVRERVHNIGWRGLLDLLFPDLLQEISPPYAGAIQMDFAQVSSRWEGDWDDYYDLAKVYTDRGMIGEVARLYEEAVEKGIGPARVDDLALFKGACAALGEEGKVREIEERIAGRIAHKMSVNLGGKVEFLGHSLRGEEGDDRLSLFFKCLEEMEEDYTLWVHGEVEDESLLEGQRREAGYAVFDHLLSTSRWRVGEVYQDDKVKGLKPGRYHFTLGLWQPEDESRLWLASHPDQHAVELGWVEIK